MNKNQKIFEKYSGNDILFVSILSISISFLTLSLFMDVLISYSTMATNEAIIRLAFRIGAWYGISIMIMAYYMKEKLGRYRL